MELLVIDLPCIVFEDEHLLVVNKPAGVNTHAPAPFAGEGIFDFLRGREPRWATLAIVHRLDKETSGLLVFTKTPLANKSLTDQFTRRSVEKRYLFLTDRRPDKREWTCKSRIGRCGERYRSVAGSGKGEEAITRFRWLHPGGPSVAFQLPGHSAFVYLLEATPLTGRTHQIRVHAAESGCPLLGDVLYGGTGAERVCLHATSISFAHPETSQRVNFERPPAFEARPRDTLRDAFIQPAITNACRVVHGSPDGFPGLYVDRLGQYLLAQTSETPRAHELAELNRQMTKCSAVAAAERRLQRHVRRLATDVTSPRMVAGEPPPEVFVARENGVVFEMSFTEGYSMGLFLDQRENRRRLLTGYVGPGFHLAFGHDQSPVQVLNTFAYTCGFSVCAAMAGAIATSLDLSKKYLEWGKRNFMRNKLDPARHDFVYGDTFDWLRRWAKKGRTFDLVILDPPTFSQSKQTGVFRVEKDFGKLVKAALGVLKPGGVLFCSTNAESWSAEEFSRVIEESITAESRRILRRQYVPQPLDFPISREEPAYLKTLWLRVE